MFRQLVLCIAKIVNVFHARRICNDKISSYVTLCAKYDVHLQLYKTNGTLDFCDIYARAHARTCIFGELIGIYV